MWDQVLSSEKVVYFFRVGRTAEAEASPVILAQSKMQFQSIFQRAARSLKSFLMQLQSGSSQNQRLRTQLKQVANSLGMPQQRSSIGISTLRYLIDMFLYSFQNENTYSQGSYPIRKQISMQPTLSRSSLRLCWWPMWFCTDLNLSCPWSKLQFPGGMCSPLTQNFRALPKSIMQIFQALAPSPTKKFQGLMSLWMNLFECINQIREKICQLIISTVFRLNFFLQQMNRSQRLGPSTSITKSLQSPSLPAQQSFGIPTPPSKILQILAQCSKCFCSWELTQILMQTQFYVWMSLPRWMAEKAP